MSTAKKKYYVVWEGVEPGVYDSWDECKEQVESFPGAKYRSYKSREEAIEAYRGDANEQLALMRSILEHTSFKRPCVILGSTQRDYTTIPEIRLDAYATDGACAGNPGPMEYRAVRVVDGAEVFHVGGEHVYYGTNNIAEYLAIIHLAAMLKKRGDSTTPIYTDSRNTFSWLRRGRSHTTLERTARTAETLDLLARADAWLAANHPIANPILKWNTEEWGEIPADFGRK